MKFLIVFAVVLFISLHAEDDLLGRSDSLIITNNYSGAAVLLERYISEKESPEAYLKLGICYKNLMKSNEALALLEKADSLDSSNVNILINLASVYTTLGYDKEAAERYEKVLFLDPANTFAFINLAKLYIGLNKFSYAEKIYQKLLNEDPFNGYYHKQLGYVYQKQKEKEKAKYHYGKSFEINSADIFVIGNLAGIYFNENKADSAIAFIDAGLRSFPDDAKLLKLKADILYSEKEFGAAVNYIVKILANEDDSPLLYQRLGICYYQIALENFVGDAQIQKLESAAETLLKSLQLDSTQSLTALYIGMTYKELGNNSEAINYLKKAIELIYPKYTSAIYTNLALVNQREENYSEAVKFFKKAQLFDNDNPNYWYYLASVYDKYYRDKSVPLIYYQYYLMSGDSLDKRLSAYASERVTKLKEKVHFQNGNKQNNETR